MKIYLMDQISWGELLAGVQNSSPYTAFTAEFLLILISSFILFYDFIINIFIALIFIYYVYELSK